MSSPTRRFLMLLGAVIIGLTSLVVARTSWNQASQEPVALTAQVAVAEGAAERLAGAIRIKTLSTEEPGRVAGPAFAEMHRYLEAAFPRVHRTLTREVINEHSLLYTWPGLDATLSAILVSGHLDVTPVEPDWQAHWRHDPFGGVISGGFVWGRGAIDNKAGVLGVLEAVESLITEGITPRRTVFLAFGHDEEVGGSDGARAIAGRLAARAIALDTVVDEGGVIGDGVLPGITKPVALIGVAEKGFVTIELSVRTAGGHSSLPPRETAIGILSAALARLQQQPMPARLEGAARQMFDRVAPGMPLLQRAVFANLWLSRPLVVRKLSESPATNAMVRTTAAPTIFQAGTKDNALPTDARALVNFRILPGDSIKNVVEHVKKAVDDDRVHIRTAGRFSAEPSGLSRAESQGFRALETAIRRVNADVVVAPFLVVVVTDARYYADFSQTVLRFLPLRLASADLARIHGIDERIGLAEYADAIRIYRQFLLEANGFPH
jgi:carboxypeptidase PM20D1